MTFSTYAELNQKMIEYFQKGEFQQALELVEREGVNFPSDRPLVDYWKMCAAARLDDRPLVYEVADRFHQDGLWYGEMMWRLTPSFKALQGDADFERLVAESLRLQAQDSSGKEAGTLQLLPEKVSSESPVLIALHGNQSTAVGTLSFWRAAVNEGFVLTVPQSTQAMFKGAFIWDDLATSFEQIKLCYAALENELKFDPARVILAGHSMGGLVAIQMVLTGELPVRGLIANGPALPFDDAPEELEKALISAKERGLRAYFIMGENDVDIEQDAIKVFVEKMKSAGVPCELEIVPGATHDYHPDYDAALMRALKFVNND